MAYPDITWDDVVNTAQEIADDLAEFTPDQQNLVITMTNRRVPVSKFGDDTFDARRYFAAHWANMVITPPAGEGTRSSETIGSVSTGVTLAVNNPPPDRTILETQYGRSYYFIMRAHYDAYYVG